MTRRAAFPVSFGAALEKALGKASQGRLLDLARIRARWVEMVGERLAAVSAPVAIRGSTLTVWVKEPVWADSMSYYKDTILSRAREAAPKSGVTKIVITGRGSHEPVAAPAAARLPDPPLDEQATRAAEAAVERLQDSELRALFKKIILKDIVSKSRGEQNKKL